MVAVGFVRLGRTGSLDGEDRRRRRRSMMADGVRILWRGNTWRMPAGCVLRHGDGAELIQEAYAGELEVNGSCSGLIIHGVMLKMELESERFHSADGGATA